MNKREKEVIHAQLDSEKAVLKQLEKQYQTALNDINRKIRLLTTDELTQSKIYQIEYQKALKNQISSILDTLQGDEFSTIQQYLHDSYTTAFVGTAYDIAGQGIPLIMPIDQAAAVKAIMTDSKISGGLYDALGVDIKDLKKAISNEVTRGIATNQTFADIARNISNVSKVPLSNARRIARTEGHRIQQASAYDSQQAAKAKGADVVKQWDSTLDGATRPVHRELDGQIREIDEPFSAHGKKAMYPGGFGDPAEDCNCRCVSLTRARWGLDEDELQTLKERAEFFGLDKTEEFTDFKNKYLDAASMIYSPINSRNTAKGKPQGIVQFGTGLNNRQKKLLEQLGEYDASTIVAKKDVNMADLCALTAETGDEFAMFTNGSQRLIIRGDKKSVNVTVDKAKEMMQNGYRWSGHTHPGYDYNSLTASDGDYNVLKAFGQKEGIIYNSLGQYMIFSLGWKYSLSNRGRA